MNLVFQCSKNINYALYSYTYGTISESGMQNINDELAFSQYYHILESLTLIINCTGKVKHASQFSCI